MTRDEAIFELTRVYPYKEKYDEALRMAIEALSEPSEQVTGKLNKPCDSLLTDDKDGSKEQKSKLDLISREDAIEALLKETNEDGAFGYVDAKSIDDVLSALPTADAVSREEYDALRRDYYKLYEATNGLCDKILGNEETEGPDDGDRQQ